MPAGRSGCKQVTPYCTACSRNTLALFGLRLWVGSPLRQNLVGFTLKGGRHISSWLREFLTTFEVLMSLSLRHCVILFSALSLVCLSCKSRSTSSPQGSVTQFSTQESAVQTLNVSAPGIPISTFKGVGYTFSYPTSWQLVRFGDHDTWIQAKLDDDVVSFLIAGIAEKDLSRFYAAYQKEMIDSGYMGFPVSFPTGSEPTMYGAWRGDTITGYGDKSGVPMVLSVTAIRANDQLYLFQMMAPSRIEWKAYKLREALGNTLVFDHLPPESHGTGEACRNCGAMLNRTINQLTSTTVNGMR